MRVFATFKGVSYLDKMNKTKDNTQLHWFDVCNDAGHSIGTEFISKKTSIFAEIGLKVGNRYMLECKSIENGQIKVLISGKQVFKNKRCDIMRKALGTFHFIKGKFKGATIEELHKQDLSDYMIWLAKNSRNEATIKNTLEVLEIIHKKTNDKACA